MRKQERHGTDKKRTFSGERNCAATIEWLNDSANDPGRARIREMLRDVKVLATGWVVDEEDEGSLVFRGARKEFTKASKRVFKLLLRYRFAPLFFPFATRMICQWAPVTGPGGRFKRRWPPVAGEYDDYQAVFDLTWNHGEGLSKVKECSCGKWFFLRFEHQKFCSARCRDKAHKTLPESKEYRRKKAREYYWLHKNKNVK
jgi:hypothetical protein